MSNLAKDDDILRVMDDCGEQSMLTVCSLIFFGFIYFKRAKFREEKRSRILASFAKVYTREKKNWNLWVGKVDPRKKKLVSSIRESSSTRKKTQRNIVTRKLLLLFYQLYTFLLRMSCFTSRKKRCFQPIWRWTYLEELLYCLRQNIQYECFQTVKNIVFFIFEITSFEERKQQQS